MMSTVRSFLWHAKRWALAFAAAAAVGAQGVSAAETKADDALVPARQASVLACPLVSEAPKVDGTLGDPAWSKAQPLRHFAYKQRPVRYQTEGWICRDAKNFYFAARCFDDNPAKLVTEFEGSAIWKNDCIELFLVPEKKEFLFCHLVISCDGKTRGETWVLDEWGEPTRGGKVQMGVGAGREKDAWTMELSVPIAAFGLEIRPDSVWAIGFNREKHSDPAEVSSFLGGFNKPREYPDLRFDGRAVVFDGLGLANVGDAAQTVKVKLSGGEKSKDLDVALEPGKRAAIDWAGALPGLKEGDEFTIDVSSADGKPIGSEKYKLVAPPKKIEPIDPTKIPPAKFVKSVLDDPNFFPIGVWLQPAGAAAAYKKMGVNVYVGGVDCYPNPKDKAFLDAVQQHGMYVFCPFKKNYVEEKLNEHPAFLGWMFGDEPDNMVPETGKVKHTPAELIADFARIRTTDPTRPVYLNLGCSVAHERFVGRGAADEDYVQYPKACDIVSYDVYPVNSIEPNGPDRLHLVAKGIDRLRKWGGPDKRVWCWIEANKIHKGEGRAPTPDEVKTEIWMALVHGANGYGFFCHTWATTPSKVSGIDAEMQAAIAKINAEVLPLAKVLNSPTVKDGATVQTTMGSRVDAMVKQTDDGTYVFAVNMYRKPEKATISVKGLGDGKAEVLYEDRTIEVKGGKIADEFPPYAVRRYKVGK